jgi:Double zinc ribbon
MRRERRRLLKLREERLRDLGGLMLEMFRRNRFREDLLRERCEELLDVDARLHELEALLALATHRHPPARCSCGAPLLHASHFCANCGRPAGEQAVVACAICSQPLPADARFCSACGTPAGAQPLDAVPVQEVPEQDGAPAPQAQEA